MVKKLIFITIIFPLVSYGLSSCGSSEDKIISEEKSEVEINSEIKESPAASGIVRSIKVRNIGALRQVFNDSNYVHLEEARRLGIDPLSDLSSYYFMKRPIVRVSDNEFYHIDSLRHSLPYLVPEAAELLTDLGKNFIDSLHRRGGDSYTIKVTSLLRTPEAVGRLRRVNVNASDSSTHQYGTTFDISYTNFYCLDENRQIMQGDLKNLLGEVLNDLREQGRCYVKYEYKTGCFHVTARK